MQKSNHQNQPSSKYKTPPPIPSRNTSSLKRIESSTPNANRTSTVTRSSSCVSRISSTVSRTSSSASRSSVSGRVYPSKPSPPLPARPPRSSSGKSPENCFSPKATSSSISSLSSASSSAIGSNVDEDDQSTKNSQKIKASSQEENRENKVCGLPKNRGVTFNPKLTIVTSASERNYSKESVKERVNAKKPCIKEEVTRDDDEKKEKKDISMACEHVNIDNVNINDLYTQITAILISRDNKESCNGEQIENICSSDQLIVSKWVDYSDKYGLGYQLSDDSVGVLFNDFTTLLLLRNRELNYIERTENRHKYKLDNYPSHLDKKITLIKYFQNYMNEHLQKTTSELENDEKDVRSLDHIPVMRKFFRTQSAMIMYLSNGTLQINFFEDHSKIILSSKLKTITFVDKEKTFTSYKMEKLKLFGCCNADLLDRLNYASNSLQKIMGSRPNSTLPSNQTKKSGSP